MARGAARVTRVAQVSGLNILYLACESVGYSALTLAIEYALTFPSVQVPRRPDGGTIVPTM